MGENDPRNEDRPRQRRRRREDDDDDFERDDEPEVAETAAEARNRRRRRRDRDDDDESGDDGMQYVIPINTSGLAIAAGYVGLISVLCFPAPFALILGILAAAAAEAEPEAARQGAGHLRDRHGDSVHDPAADHPDWRPDE